MDMQTRVPEREKDFRGHLRVSRAAREGAEKVNRLLEEDRSPSARRLTGRDSGGEKGHVLFVETFESRKWVPIGFAVSSGEGFLYLALFPDYRGRGLAIHALRAVVTYLYQYPISRLRACIATGDRAARRTFESCGFVREGETPAGEQAWIEYGMSMRVTCPCYNIFI